MIVLLLLVVGLLVGWRIRVKSRHAAKEIEARNAEADAALYAQDPAFAVEMGYEPPKPVDPMQKQIDAMQKAGRLGASLGSFMPGVGPQIGGSLGSLLGGALGAMDRNESGRIAQMRLMQQHMQQSRQAHFDEQNRLHGIDPVAYRERQNKAYRILNSTPFDIDGKEIKS